MSKIMISELQETTSAPDSSYIAIDNGATTNKITIANYNSSANATAKRYAEASQGYATEAQTAKDDAVSAKNETETLVNAASSYANASNASANAAAGSASEASGYVGAAQTSASNALASARAAEASAADIDNQVKLAKSWAVGNTGVRANEAVCNSMYWAGQAAAAAGGGVVSFNGRAGSVLPESGDYSSDEIAHVNSDSTYSNVETEINNLQTGRLKTYASDSTQWDTTPTANSTKPVTSGGVHEAISSAVDAIEAEIQPLVRALSYVGMIIHSTTLDTEAKVKAIYGGTTWTKIEGKFLLGTSSGHAVNSTGGSETVTLTTSQIPSHNHGLCGGAGMIAFKNNAGTEDPQIKTTGSRAAINLWSTDNAGGGQPHNNMPPYKTVYIWERTA